MDYFDVDTMSLKRLMFAIAQLIRAGIDRAYVVQLQDQYLNMHAQYGTVELTVDSPTSFKMCKEGA